jgi:chorismate mutase
MEQLRKEILEIDNKIAELIAQRIDVAKKIGIYKKNHNLPILNKEQEAKVLENISFYFDDAVKKQCQNIFIKIMSVCKMVQR